MQGPGTIEPGSALGNNSDRMQAYKEPASKNCAEGCAEIGSENGNVWKRCAIPIYCLVIEYHASWRLSWLSPARQLSIGRCASVV